MRTTIPPGTADVAISIPARMAPGIRGNRHPAEPAMTLRVLAVCLVLTSGCGSTPTSPAPTQVPTPTPSPAPAPAPTIARYHVTGRVTQENGSLLSGAGFRNVAVEPTRIYRGDDARAFLSEATDLEGDLETLVAEADGAFMSAFIRAVKP